MAPWSNDTLDTDRNIQFCIGHLNESNYLKIKWYQIKTYLILNNFQHNWFIYSYHKGSHFNPYWFLKYNIILHLNLWFQLLWKFIYLAVGGKEGYGQGVITSLVTFDREERSEYYMPIIMKDGGKPPRSGTNTLTITIGDKNDNEHFPAHKNVHVYNYRGKGTECDSIAVVGVIQESNWFILKLAFRIM